MVMRKIRGSKTRRQENGEDHITRSFMTCTPHQILFGVIKLRRMKWAGNVARMRDRRGAYRVLVGRPDGNRPLGRPRCRFLPQVFLFCTVCAWRPWGVRRYYETTDLSSANMSHTDHCANQHCSVAVVVNPEVYTFTRLTHWSHTVSVFGRFLTLAYTADPSADHALSSVWSYCTRSVYRYDASF